MPLTIDPRLPSILRGWQVTDDTGNMLEIMDPEGRKYMVYRHLIDMATAYECERLRHMKVAEDIGEQDQAQ